MEKAFIKPYEQGWASKPAENSWVTPQIMDNYDQAIDEIDNRVIEMDGTTNGLIEDLTQLSNYPYTETQIGVLADGKKIYRRVYTYSGDLALVDNTWTKTNIAWMGATYILKAQICMSNGLMLYVDTGNVEGMLAFNHHRTVTLSQTSTMLIILEYAK